ncbi:MAG: pectin esterase [Bacteroidetes bacterium]|nr:pectin esterase [Bacteroidota bacterium]
MKFILKTILIFIFITQLNAQRKSILIVDQNGSGDFTTLTEAVNSLPMFNYERITILVKKGVYEEKIRFDQDYITLEGEDRDSTIIKYNQLREDWAKEKDSIGPAVININGDDVIFKNLTVINTQPEIGPHAFVLYGTGTRTIITNCSMISKGADTVSLWDYKTGMYYHANCYFEGAVDFVCPRGWCFIRDSQFYEVKKTAAIWHAGGYDQDQKFVIKNSTFDGVEGFQLGRHHYEAQFYLLNCKFSDKMSSDPIYRVTYEDTTRNRPFNWGKRYYFSKVEKEGKSLEWLKDNLETNNHKVTENEITPLWTFDGKWNPESEEGPKIIDYMIYKNEVIFKFDEPVSVQGNPLLTSKNNVTFTYISGGGTNTLKFITDSDIKKEELMTLVITNGATIHGNIASVKDRNTSFEIIM